MTKSSRAHLTLTSCDTMKKLAIFTGSDLRNFGGGEKDVIGLGNKLRSRFDVTLFTFRGKTGVRATDKVIKKMTKVDYVYYNAYVVPLVHDRIPFTYSGLKAIFSLRKFDVIYSMDSSLAINYMILAISRIYRRRFIAGIHTPGYLRDSPIEPNLAKNIMIKLYNPLRNLLVRGIPNIRIQNRKDRAGLLALGYAGKIYNIPPHVFYKIRIREGDFNKKNFIVLFVGRLSIKHKGLDLLAKVIDSTLQRNRDVIFHIVGSGDDGERLIGSLAKKYPDNVKWFGFVSEKELDREYRNANLFMLTSRGENFGISLGEALGYGIPSLAFDVMGSQDIITDKTLGNLIRPFSIRDYSAKIIHYCNEWKKDKNAYLKRKLIISRIANAVYSDDVVVPQMARMFDEDS